MPESQVSAETRDITTDIYRERLDVLKCLFHFSLGFVWCWLWQSCKFFVVSYCISYKHTIFLLPRNDAEYVFFFKADL